MHRPPLPQSPERYGKGNEHERPEDRVAPQERQSHSGEGTNDERRAGTTERGDDRTGSSGGIGDSGGSEFICPICGRAQTFSPLGVQQLTLAVCMGGHGTEPYEQKTQQSPDFGFNCT